MNSTMQGFTKLDRELPDKSPPPRRIANFHEIYAQYAKDKAAGQAGRCAQCGVPFCQIHCPLANNIPDWLLMVANGRMKEAYQLASATNNMPEICGRICPQDRLCEGNCTIEQSGHGTVTIGAIERYIVDTAWQEGWVEDLPLSTQYPFSVGIIGAGPAGLTAAEELRRKGYQVTIYDQYDRAGGLLIYGIPGFKLEKPVVLRRVERLVRSGIEFVLNCRIGREISLEKIRTRHDAVLLATGVYKSRALQIPKLTKNTMAAEEKPTIVPALDYLTISNRKGLGDSVPEFDEIYTAKDKRVLVIGGGDTAMDCVRTAIRQQARSVHCGYRRDRANMPGSHREVDNAMEEGIKFLWTCAPKALIPAQDQKSWVMRMQKMRLSLPDETGRQTPKPVEGSDFSLDADLIIAALGFDPEDYPVIFGEPNLACTRWGTIKIDFKSRMTNLDGVFAAGDMIRGASLVVWAIRDGREAASQIDHYIQAQNPRQKVA